MTHLNATRRTTRTNATRFQDASCRGSVNRLSTSAMEKLARLSVTWYRVARGIVLCREGDSAFPLAIPVVGSTTKSLATQIAIVFGGRPVWVLYQSAVQLKAPMYVNSFSVVLGYDQKWLVNIQAVLTFMRRPPSQLSNTNRPYCLSTIQRIDETNRADAIRLRSDRLARRPTLTGRLPNQ